MSSSTEYGVWSDFAGGFIVAQCYSRDEAAKHIEGLVKLGEEREDLTIFAICDYHNEQPARACEFC